CEHSPATWRPVAPDARRSHSRQTSCRGPPRRTPFARANDQRARTLLTFGGSDAGHPCGRFLFMSSARVATRPPLVLIADSHEWFSRALETVLVPGGYRVVKAYTARGALQQVEASEPDARVLGEAARTWVAVGRFGPREFAVIAPGTGSDAAPRLAERLAGALTGRPRRVAAVPAEFLAGYDAVPDAAVPKFDPATLLAHASAALAAAAHDPAGGRIRKYENGAGRA